MDTAQQSPTPRRSRRFRRFAVAGTCAVALVAAGVTTYAHAAVPDGEVGLEGCKLTWTAVQGGGSVSMGDVHGAPDSVGPPSGSNPDSGPSYAFDTNEEVIGLGGVTDLTAINLNCTGVNNSTRSTANFEVSFGVAEPVTDSVPLGTCVFIDTNTDSSPLGFAEPPANFNFDLEGLQCDNPTEIRVHRRATTQLIDG